MPPTGLTAIELVAKLYKLPSDMRIAIREFGINGVELTPEVMVRVAKTQQLKAKIKSKLSVKQIYQNYPLPAIEILPDGHYLVFLKQDETRQVGLCFDPELGKTIEKPLDMFGTNWIIVSPRVFNPNVQFGLEWFFKEFIVYKRVIAEVLLGSFFIQIFGLVTPLITQVILDKVIVHNSINTLNVLAFAFVAIMIFELLLNLSRNYIFTHTVNKIDAKLGAKLFKHLFSLPFPFFESRKVGTIISCIREMETVREFVANKSISLLIDLCFSFIFVAVMLVYSVKLTLIVLSFVVVIAVLYLAITPMFKKRLEEKFQMAAASNSYLIEAVTGVQTVKSLAIEGMMQKNWENRLGEFLGSNFSLQKVSNLANSLSSLFQRLMNIAILYFGVQMVLTNQMTIGQLIAFNMLSGQMTMPVLRLVGMWNEFQQALLGINKLGDILNHPTEVSSSETNVSLPDLKGHIRFDNIHFRYMPSMPQVFNGLSIEVPPGCMVGLVGKSGSGKSTLTKLLQRLYLPETGAIYLDGVDSRHLDPKWLRYQIGVVLQDNYLFSGSIRENIMMPRPDASMEMIIEASRVAGAHEFISELPEGYDTIVGERGSSLSGGQRQRIAIARAIITNPRILIFDEATSALDYESEAEIVKNFNQIRQGRTVIVIAHRYSTVRSCDVIIALEKGRILEAGTHDDLISRKGYFYQLAQQSRMEA
jgi:ATP-binding cassette, subfamily B, bacterial HlyB/CyaB